jgi:hypothetical protein
MTNNPKSRNKELVVQETGDEICIYDSVTNRMFSLNPTAAFVWQNCDGQKSIAEISRALAQSSGQLVAHDVVWLAIEELKSFNLMEKAETPFDGFKTLDRRQVIKRIGLASTVALPVIAGLLAPKAASAASSCGASCINNGDCITANCPICRGFGTCGASNESCTDIGSPCTVTGFCTGGGMIPIYTCSIPGGICGGPGPCFVSATCNGLGTCQA